MLVGLFSAVDSPIFTNFVTCWARELVNCGGVGMRPSLLWSIVEGFRGRLWLSVGEKSGCWCAPISVIVEYFGVSAVVLVGFCRVS